MGPARRWDRGELAALLHSQSDLIRRDQAKRRGMSDEQIARAVRRGLWQRILPRVYLVGDHRLTPERRIRAAWLWAGRDSVIAESASAWWQGLHTAFPPRIAVLVPPRRRLTGRKGLTIVRSAVDQRDLLWVNGIRVTSVSRTCLDLVRVGRDEILEYALSRGRLGRDELRASLERGRHRRGQVSARQAVTAVADHPWSRPERHAHRLLHDAGVTGWVANERAHAVSGTVMPDIAFEDVMLAVEIDGREFHDETMDVGAFERDHARHLALVAAGWTVLRFTVLQIMEQPDLFIGTIQSVLARLNTAGALSEPL